MTQKTESLVRTIGAIVTMVLLVGGIVVGYTRLEVGPVETRVTAVESKLGVHADNMSIHRTAEEARERERSEEARWDQLFRELDQINKRMDNLERRPR